MRWSEPSNGCKGKGNRTMTITQNTLRMGGLADASLSIMIHNGRIEVEARSRTPYNPLYGEVGGSVSFVGGEKLTVKELREFAEALIEATKSFPEPGQQRVGAEGEQGEG